MEVFLPDSIQALLLVLIGVAFALSRLARALPDVTWLQVFRLPAPNLTEEERARRRRHGNRLAAIEMMLAGLILPLLFVVSTVVLFNDFKMLPTILVGAASVACFVTGGWILVRNR